MHTDDRLDSVLDAWQKAFERGSDIPAADLCRGCPELLPEVERRIAVIRRMARLDAPTGDADGGDGTLSHAGGSATAAAPHGEGHAARADAPPGFEIVGELGRGGMGVVYEARQASLNRVVALKMVRSGSRAGASELLRFRSEGEAVARLTHPNVVQVFEVGVHAGCPFLVLEFCAGGSLDAKLVAAPLPPREAAALVATLARAVHAAHEAGIVHRDLKPANVLLAADGTPKVADFGLAKWVEAEGGLTVTGDVLGTPSYMAPEQASGRGNATDRRADVYALGAVLYACVTGRPPFRGATPLDTLDQVRSHDPAPVRTLQPTVPRDLETVCLKCLEKEAARRYPTAEALAADLDRFLSGRPTAARPVGRGEQAWRWCRRNPAVAGLLAAVLLVFATGAGVAAYFAVEAGERARDAADRELEANDERDRVRTEQAKVLDEQQKVLAEQDRTRRLVHLNQMNNASSALGGNRIDQVRRWLDAARPGPGEPDVRGWEWHYLDRLTQPQSRAFPVSAPGFGHGGGFVSQVMHLSSVTPDGRRLVVRHLSGSEMKLDVWDVATGRRVVQVRTPVPDNYPDLVKRDPTFASNTPAISSDGSHIAFLTRVWKPHTYKGKPVSAGTGSLAYRVRIWEVATGKEVPGPDGEFSESKDLCVGTGAEWLAWVEDRPRPAKPGAAGQSPGVLYTVCRWDRMTGQTTRRPVERDPKDEPGTTTESCWLVPDGRSLVWNVQRNGKADDPGDNAAYRTEVWEVSAEGLRRRWHTQWMDYDFGRGHSAGGRAFSIAKEDRFTVHRLEDGTPIWKAVLPFDEWIKYEWMQVSDDGTRAVAFAGTTLFVFDRDGEGVNAPVRVTRHPASEKFVANPILTADGKTLLAEDPDGKLIRVWDLTRDPARTIRWDSTREADRSVVSRDYRFAAEYRPRAADAANPNAGRFAVALRDVATGKEVGVIEPPGGYQTWYQPAEPKKGDGTGGQAELGHWREVNWPSPESGCSFAPGGGLLLVRYQKAGDPGPTDKVVVYEMSGLRQVATWDIPENRRCRWVGPWIVEDEFVEKRRGSGKKGEGWYELEGFKLARDGRTGEVVPAFPRPESEPFGKDFDIGDYGFFAVGFVPDPSGERLAETLGRPLPPPSEGSRPTKEPAPQWSGEYGVRVRDARTGREVWSRPELGRVIPDGREKLLVGFTSPRQRLMVSDPVFSPDGKRLAVRNYWAANGVSTVWVGRAADGADERLIEVPGDLPPHLRPGLWFSRDGGRLAVSSGNELLVWDLETGTRVARLLNGQTPIEWAAFTPDGRRLLMAPSDGGRLSMSVWDLSLGRELIAFPFPRPDRFPGVSPFVGEKLYLSTRDGVWVFDGTPRKE